MEGVGETIRQFIVRNFLFGEERELRPDTSFVEEGLVDSTGILELVAFVENEFGIEVRDEELVPENFDSIANIVAFLNSKGGSSGEGSVRLAPVASA
ncbi:acyl carrier protein [Geobacter pickeringii]|uniref:Acyl carrier protein n=1 Tax=Geobacter pickeringii TaxID=345632 RepID=A0A0B5B9S4_9BACT|nr:acyl carrier protein [Geobacter pickeringii]AJE03468.1 acyl carrier protein [Geobacter pickeringii]